MCPQSDAATLDHSWLQQFSWQSLINTYDLVPPLLIVFWESNFRLTFMKGCCIPLWSSNRQNSVVLFIRKLTRYYFSFLHAKNSPHYSTKVVFIHPLLFLYMHTMHIKYLICWNIQKSFKGHNFIFMNSCRLWQSQVGCDAKPQCLLHYTVRSNSALTEFPGGWEMICSLLCHSCSVQK